MSFDVAHLWGAWLIGAAGAVALVAALAALRPQSVRRRLVALLLPGAAAAFALLAAAGLSLRTGGSVASHIVLLLDTSASARASPWQNPDWLRSLARLRLPSTTRLTIVGFDDAPRLLLDDVSPGDPGRWPSAWPDFATHDASDLAAALDWKSAAERRGEASGPRWIVTDGLLHWPPPPARAPPIAVTIVPSSGDAAITDLLVRDGALWARIRAVGQVAPRTLDIRRNGQPLAQRRLTFDTPVQWLTLPIDNAAARFDLRLNAADPWPENDAATLLHAGPGPARILRLSGRGGERNHEEALSPDAWKLTAAGWQAIELDDVSAGDLSAAQWRAVDGFVRDTGGGLLLAGARRAFGPGDYPAAAVAEDLSPLASRPPDGPAARVVFLIDASASMREDASAAAGVGEQKFRLASRGVQSAAALLRPEDTLAVVAFNTTATLLTSGTQSAVAPTLAAALDRVQPAGGTFPDAALADAAAALRGDSPRKLCVLLTDGEIPNLDVAAWQGLLGSSRARLVIVAPRAARTGPLAALAAGHLWLDGDAPGAWPALLRQAVATLLAGRARSDTLAWQDPADHLSGTAGAWIETWPKPEASVIASGTVDGGSWPAGATAQRGLGRVAALPLDANDPGSARLKEALLHAILPAPGDRRFSLSIAPDSGGGGPETERWLLTADGVADGHFLDGESLVARVPDPEGGAFQNVPMFQSGPGHYTARLSSAEGAIVLRHSSGGDQLVGRLEAPVLADHEFPATVPVPADPPRAFEQLSPYARDPDPWRPRLAGRPHDLTVPLLLSSVACLLGALFGRRIGRP